MRDSSGVRIVEHSRFPEAVAPLAIGERPLLELDTQREVIDHELNFRRPYLIARPLSDGRWVALDLFSLKVFDREGRFVRTIGRRGSGPGEFRQLRDFCVLPGDTIVAVSLSERRIAAFDSAGRHLRTAVLEGQVGRSPCLDRGTVLVHGVAMPFGESGHRQRAVLEMVRWDGTDRVRLGLVEVESADLTFPGIVNVIGEGDEIVVGTGEAPEYRVLRSDGTTRLLVRWHAEMRPVPPSLRAEYVRSGHQASSVERPYLPVYRRLAVAEDGSVWVQDRPDHKVQSFLVFDRVGLLIGQVKLPTSSRIPVDAAWIGSGRILLGYREADGTPHVAVHALTRLR